MDRIPSSRANKFIVFSLRRTFVISTMEIISNIKPVNDADVIPTGWHPITANIAAASPAWELKPPVSHHVTPTLLAGSGTGFNGCTISAHGELAIWPRIQQLCAPNWNVITESRTTLLRCKEAKGRIYSYPFLNLLFSVSSCSILSRNNNFLAIHAAFMLQWLDRTTSQAYHTQLWGKSFSKPSSDE